MKQLKKIFPFLTFENKNFEYAVVNTLPKREATKNIVRYGSIYLFISDNMYPNTDRDFVYATLEQTIIVKPYRCKNSFTSTFNKQYWSAKTRKELIEKLKTADTNFKFN